MVGFCLGSTKNFSKLMWYCTRVQGTVEGSKAVKKQKNKQKKPTMDERKQTKRRDGMLEVLIRERAKEKAFELIEISTVGQPATTLLHTIIVLRLY